MTNLNLKQTLTAALLSTALILSACVGGATTVTPTASNTSATTETETREVETDNGTVTVPANPQRVVVLVNAVLAYLDLGGTPVGVTEVGDTTLADLPAEQQAAYRAATNVASSSGEIDLEKIASLEPDVIIIQTGDSQFAEIGEELNSIAPTVFLGQASDWEFRVVAFATAGNLLDTMNAQKAKYDELLVTIKQDYADVLKTTKIAETYRGGWTEAGQFSLNQSLCAEVARDEGIFDFAESVPMSFEQIGDLATYDLILYPATSEGQPTAGIQPLLETNAWKLLPAVEAGHAQGVYCPWGRSYGFMSQYLTGLEQALATLSPATSTTDDPSTGAESGTRQVEADNGTIQVPADPQRVATIGNTTLPFIDLGGKPIAVTAVSDSAIKRLPEDQQETYASATILAASADEVDMEELASLKPDLILVQIPDAEFELIKKQLEVIAPTVFYGLDTEWKDLADGIAEAGNTTDALSEQKAELEARIAEIQENYRELIDGTSFVDINRWASSDPGTFAIADIGCSEIARDDVGLNLPKAADGQDPLAYTSLSFEQLGELSEYDVILYPVDAEGQPTESFTPVLETNSWQALPEVSSGHALGVFCPGNNSYGAVLRYLDSLDRALAALPTQ